MADLFRHAFINQKKSKTMKKYKQIYITVLTIVALLIVCSVNAANFHNLPRQLTQPNGTVLNCFVTGDEFHHWYHDAEGYTIAINDQTGFYVYADIVNGQFTYTNLIPGIDLPATHGLKPGYQPASEVIEEKSKLRRESLNENSDYGGVPSTGNINNLVVFIHFADQEEFTDLISEYEQLYNGKGQSISLENYFYQMSNWQLDIESHFFPQTSNIVKSYQDIHPRNYYCKYNLLLNPEGYKNESEHISREQKMLERAIEYVDSEITYSGLDYDVNDDLVVDNVDFIIQGAEDELGGDILWPHNWVLYSEWAFIGNWFDNRMVWTYNVQLSEFYPNCMGTGVLCHEMYHSIGAPDLYHYLEDWDHLSPVAYWDIMAGTPYNPQQMGAYMKYRYGHWFNYIPEITESGTYTLQPLSTDPYACFKIQSPFSPNEFFILEYRKREGLFDQNLHWSYDEGLVVYRINPNYSGNEYATPGKDEIYIYRPDGTLIQNGEVWYAAFSASNGRTNLNDFTNPACFLSNGNYGGLDISNVSETGNQISFVVWGNNVNPPHNLQAQNN